MIVPRHAAFRQIQRRLIVRKRSPDSGIVSNPDTAHRMIPSPFFAIHIADGILAVPWQIGGFLLLIALVGSSLFRIDEREIPRVGVLTAAFFVASQLHVPLGPISVHLLLNGLVGVILRWRAPLAISVGLALQALLFGHGGWLVLGVNFGILAIPAILAGLLYRVMSRAVKPFATGATVGGVTALATVLIHTFVLWLGGSSDFRAVASVSLLTHLPVIAIEAVAVGFACRVLAKAKPEWLDRTPPADL
jgi:cobalt/nickel transport system permease protein